MHAEGILPGWDGIVPAVELEARLGMPVQVENDANAGAIGEHLFGAGRGVQDMVYVQLAAGIGVGLILGGRPFRGAVGVAGEIGHTTVVEDGADLPLRQPRLPGDRRELGRGRRPARAQPRAGRVAGADARAPARRRPRRRARAAPTPASAVGVALTATVNLLNPSLVIIGGELAEAGDVLLDPIRAAIERRAVPPAAAAVRVIAGELGERAEVLGAASIQLARAPQALAARLAA